MAGRKHHHVPQLLQRRFGLRTRKKTTVTVYWRDGRVFPTATENFGGERDFYAPEGDSFVDDLITEYEGQLPTLLDSIEAGEVTSAQSKEAISQLVAHLEIRTRFLRVQLAKVSESVLATTLSKMLESRYLPKYLKTYYTSNPGEIEGFFQKHGIRPEQTRQARQLIEDFWEVMFSPENLADSVQQLRKGIEAKPLSFIDVAASSQTKVLEQSPSTVKRGLLYTDWKFRVERSRDESFILPDTMLAFADGNRVAPFNLNPKSGEALILPLSPVSALVGFRKSPRPISPKALNKMLSSCSFEAFVSSSDLPQHRALIKRIGDSDRLLTEQEVRRMISKILADLS